MQSKDGQALTEDGDPVYRRNPHPQQAYRITMTIENAPGPFEWISATAFYQMNNHSQCTPMEPIAGVWSKSKEDGVPVHFRKVDATRYVAAVYADGMINADYYGKGVCIFELNGLGVTLRATGEPTETRFQPALSKNEIIESTSKTTYFWSGGYPKDEMDDYPDTGKPSPDGFKQELRDRLFKVTLRAIEEAP